MVDDQYVSTDVKLLNICVTDSLFLIGFQHLHNYFFSFQNSSVP